MNTSNIKLLAAFLLCAAPWTTPALASTACLLDDASKVCLDLNTNPADVVQPSQAGHTPTYVKFTATLRNVGLSSSSRNIALTLDITPAVDTFEYTTTAGLSCSRAGATMTCSADKLTASEARTLTWTVAAPTSEGDLTGTAVFGWNGRTATASKSLTVSDEGGSTWVPANTSVTLVTSPETDPSGQVTAESPLWAKIKLPPRDEGYFARVEVITDGPDSSASCLGGSFYASGGAYVCRDTGMPKRWVLTTLPADSFTPESPVQFTVMWDTTIVPATQLPPTEVAPTGLPEFAIFYNQTEVGVPFGPTRAFANTCDVAAPVAPCINAVTRLDNGDWSADFLKANDGSDMSDPLARLMNYLLSVAHAGLPFGPIVK